MAGWRLRSKSTTRQSLLPRDFCLASCCFSVQRCEHIAASYVVLHLQRWLERHFVQREIDASSSSLFIFLPFVVSKARINIIIRDRKHRENLPPPNNLPPQTQYSIQPPRHLLSLLPKLLNLLPHLRPHSNPPKLPNPRNDHDLLSRLRFELARSEGFLSFLAVKGPPATKRRTNEGNDEEVSLRESRNEGEGKKGRKREREKETDIAAPIRFETEKNIPTKGRDSRREAVKPKPVELRKRREVGRAVRFVWIERKRERGGKRAHCSNPTFVPRRREWLDRGSFLWRRSTERTREEGTKGEGDQRPRAKRREEEKEGTNRLVEESG